MLIKTHLIITLFFVLLLLPFVSHKIVFILLALLATYVPDIDTKNSKLGKKKIFRPLQIFMKHRGFFHSFTFLFLITLVFVIFVPILALGFFLGYSSHLLADGFTLEGIMPFYPWKRKIFGRIRTGSQKESIILVTFLILDVLLVLRYILAS
jgi:inner membrane protein